MEKRIGLVYKKSVSKLNWLNYGRYIRTIGIAVVFWLIFWTQLDLSKIFSMSRNTSRQNHVNQIMDGITSYQTDGQYSALLADLPDCDNPIMIGSDKNNLDLFEILEGFYLLSMPIDPKKGTLQDTGYNICMTDHDRIKIESVYAEDGHRIAIIR